MAVATLTPDQLPLFPWSAYPSEQRRFYKILAGSLGLFLTLFLLLGEVIEPPTIERTELERAPERVAKLVLENKEVPPPPPAAKAPELEPAPKPEPPKPEPPKVEEPPKVVPKPEPAPQPKPRPIEKLQPRQVKPIKATEAEINQARDKASKTGILAMKDQLAALQQSADIVQLSGGRLNKGGAGRKGSATTDLIARRAKSDSGGIETTQVDAPQRELLASRETTVVTGPIETVSRAEVLKQQAEHLKQRSNEEIALVFDRHKAAFYALYRRALRKSLGIKGRIVFRLEIAASGKITSASVVSSELNDAKLESQLLARIKQMEFGERKVEPWQDNFHIDFSPSG